MRKLLSVAIAIFLMLPCVAKEPKTVIAANSPEITYVGRTLVGNSGDVSFDWSGTYLTIRFTGSYCAVRVSDTKKNYYNLFVDGNAPSVITTFGRDSIIVLANGIGNGEHTLRLQKRTEAEQGRTTIHSFELSAKGKLIVAPHAFERHIEFIGNSLTCGYGTEGLSKDEPFKAETENCNKAYGCIISRFFDADYTLIAHSGRGAARNYGDKSTVSKNTMADRMDNLFDEDQTIEWDYSESPYKPDIVVINLGSNDFSTMPQPSREEFIDAYKRIVAKIRSGHGSTTPILCVAPRVAEPAFTYICDFCNSCGDKNIHFAAILPKYCNEDSDLGSSAHPNYQGQRKMAMLLIPYISSITGWDVGLKTIE